MFLYIVIAILALAIGIIPTVIHYKLKIAKLKKSHETALKLEFDSSFLVGYDEGKIEGRRAGILEQIKLSNPNK